MSKKPVKKAAKKAAKKKAPAKKPKMTGPEIVAAKPKLADTEKLLGVTKDNAVARHVGKHPALGAPFKRDLIGGPSGDVDQDEFYADIARAKPKGRDLIGDKPGTHSTGVTSFNGNKLREYMKELQAAVDNVRAIYDAAKADGFNVWALYLLTDSDFRTKEIRQSMAAYIACVGYDDLAK